MISFLFFCLITSFSCFFKKNIRMIIGRDSLNATSMSLIKSNMEGGVEGCQSYLWFTVHGSLYAASLSKSAQVTWGWNSFESDLKKKEIQFSFKKKLSLLLRVIDSLISKEAGNLIDRISSLICSIHCCLSVINYLWSFGAISFAIFSRKKKIFLDLNEKGGGDPFILLLLFSVSSFNGPAWMSSLSERCHRLCWQAAFQRVADSQ